jgi:hypothetical protein
MAQASGRVWASSFTFLRELAEAQAPSLETSFMGTGLKKPWNSETRVLLTNGLVLDEKLLEDWLRCKRLDLRVVGKSEISAPMLDSLLSH